MNSDHIRWKVAELMGWTNLQYVETKGLGGQLQGAMPGSIPSKFTNYVPMHAVPAYESDIAAAWKVVEKFDLLRGGDHNRTLGKSGSGWCVNEFQNVDEWDEYSGATATEAICRAAIECEQAKRNRERA